MVKVPSVSYPGGGSQKLETQAWRLLASRKYANSWSHLAECIREGRGLRMPPRTEEVDDRQGVQEEDQLL